MELWQLRVDAISKACIARDMAYKHFERHGTVEAEALYKQAQDTFESVTQLVHAMRVKELSHGTR